MTIEAKIKLFAALLTLAALFFSLFQFLQVQSIEAQRPYLEKKLVWCEEAVETTAKIANSPLYPAKEVTRFWELYYGVMGMIEKENVTSAMVAFGRALRSGEPADGGVEFQGHALGLPNLSLAIAHACRKELSKEWSASWSR